MRRILDLLVLPDEMSEFERAYLARLNRVALIFLVAHVPVFTLIAWLNDTGPLDAALLTLGVLAGPVLAYRVVANPRTRSVVYGMAAMGMGGVLVHVGQGPTQIEMHFYFFALIAMCCVFGNPLVIVAATLTVTLHHVGVWMMFPRSMFNYEAAWWVGAIHVGFVLLEATASCFIAKSFFDNVIGLERVVQARTVALDSKNRDMRMLLDNVEQGFLTIDRSAAIATERSAAIDRWFGPPTVGASWFDYVATVSPAFGHRSRVAWVEVSEDVMPIELTIDQMPRSVTVGQRELVVEYRPIGAAQPHDRFLVMVTDVTAERTRERNELERRDLMGFFEHMITDRDGVERFLEEGNTIVGVLEEGAVDFVTTRRLVHTLKGNAALFGLEGIAQQSDELEDVMRAQGSVPSPSQLASLIRSWRASVQTATKFLGDASPTVALDEAQLLRVEDAIRRGEPTTVLLRRVAELRDEPLADRFTRFASQARQIAERIDKRNVTVRIEDDGVRIDHRAWSPFWGTFVHAIRNAIDHGLETVEEREVRGKPQDGVLTLRARLDGLELTIEVEDDGRGVDWEAIRLHAQRAGIPCSTEQDLQEALFVDGLSTARSGSTVSGRGVGMSALLAATRTRGGHVVVRSRPGEGTVICMVFPATTHVARLAHASQ